MRNGWRNIYGYPIYVEQGRVLRGMKRDSNGHWVPAYAYRLTRCGWTSAGRLTVSAFRAGMNRNTIMMM